MRRDVLCVAPARAASKWDWIRRRIHKAGNSVIVIAGERVRGRICMFACLEMIWWTRKYMVIETRALQNGEGNGCMLRMRQYKGWELYYISRWSAGLHSSLQVDWDERRAVLCIQRCTLGKRWILNSEWSRGLVAILNSWTCVCNVRKVYGEQNMKVPDFHGGEIDTA